jgi:predicted small lipoprotein YifL
MRKLILLSFLCVATAFLGACGKKGEPVVPQGEQDHFPGKYPKEYN